MSLSERNQTLKITECMTAFTRKCPEKVNLERQISVIVRYKAR